jgi:hypothetical protein
MSGLARLGCEKKLQFFSNVGGRDAEQIELGHRYSLSDATVSNLELGVFTGTALDPLAGVPANVCEPRPAD